MTPTGIEPVLPPWKGDVLTAWPRSRITVCLPAVTFSQSPGEFAKQILCAHYGQFASGSYREHPLLPVVGNLPELGSNQQPRG